MANTPGRLPTRPGGEPQDPRSELQKLIAEDQASNKRESSLVKKTEAKGRGKRIALIATGGVVTAAIVAGLVIYDPFTGALRFGDGQATVAIDPDQSSSDNQASGPVASNAPKEWYQQEENIYPIALEDWQKEQAQEESAFEVVEYSTAKEVATDLGSSALTLPTEEAGFTSDSNQALLEDGTINPLFSYWTAEVFRGEAGNILEMLVNPRFGGWEDATYIADSFSSATLSTVFTDRWLSEEGATKTNYPVFVDWSGGQYGLGDSLLESGTRWFGEVTSSTTDFVYDEATLQYKAKVVAEVRYTAWANDQTKIEKTGTLALDLVANPDRSQKLSDRRVLVDSASLEVR